MFAHLRVARATDRLDEIARFYRAGLGFELVGEFRDHDGFDGVILGHADAGYHFEFTLERESPARRPPDAESLLVFYLPDADAFHAATTRVEALGHAPVASHNPFWDRNGRTYEDPDGCRIVLCHGAWENRPRDRPQASPRSADT